MLQLQHRYQTGKCTGNYGIHRLAGYRMALLGPYLSARVRVAGVNTGRLNAVLNYGVSKRLRTGLSPVRSRTV